MIKALQQKEKMEQKAEQMSKRSSWELTETEKNTSNKIQLAIQSIKERGIKRFVKQIFAITGKIITKNGEIKRLILNPFYPMIDRIKMALQALLESYQITVTMGKTKVQKTRRVPLERLLASNDGR